MKFFVKPYTGFSILKIYLCKLVYKYNLFVHYNNTLVFCKYTFGKLPYDNRKELSMLGDRIKHLRTARNMSQVELAAALNVSKQSVSNWENDNILPSVEIIKQLANYFSCSSDYLLELSDSTNAYIDVSDLPQHQVAHLQALARDLRDLNIKKGM